MPLTEIRDMNLNVRECTKDDINLIVNYFHNSDSEFLKSMGADINKLPNKKSWIKKLRTEFEKPITEKEYYYIIWLLEDKPIGHSNINNIHFREIANMHLHLWENMKRKKGIGIEFLNQTIPYYFDNFKLDKLICEPYSKNPAPNRTLRKLGFDFIKEYETIPGMINFTQIVNHYELTKEHYLEIYNGT